ncbi:MAG: TasA family protein [Christensenellales bacterium]|jgi:hypothetical protein
MKKKVLVLSLAVALIAITAIGLTLAYFTSESEPVTNVFTLGEVKIELDEPAFELNEKYDENAGKIVNLAPGDVINKDPYITNTGTNDAWVFMKLTLSDADAFDNFAGDVGTDLIAADLVNWEVISAGKDAANDEFVVWIGYKQILPAFDAANPDANKTTAAFTTISIPTSWTAEDIAPLGGEFVIEVTGYAIQSDNIATLEAAAAALASELE